VGDSKNEALWKNFDTITKLLRSTIPYYSARGNHDNTGGHGYEDRVLGGMRPDNTGRVLPTRPGGNEYFYAFDKGPLRFIAIDTEQDKTLQVGGKQYAWLESELADAKAQHLFPIVFFHEAIFSIGAHGSANGKHGNNIDLQTPLHPLFQRYGVKLVFQGHDHLYYRTVRDGVTYIVTGGGGAPLYDFNHIEDAIPGDKYEKDYHFCVCDVFDDKIVVTVLRHTLQQLEPPFTISLP
jgi:3',5'-cyclic AMP phosphodiesterase CpdA